MDALHKLKIAFEKLGLVAQQHSELVSEFSRLETEYFGFGMSDDKDTHTDDIIVGHMLGEGMCDFSYYLDRMEEARNRRRG